MEARFGALQGDTRRLSAQLEVPVRGFLNLKNKEKPIQGALGGIKIVIVRQGSMLGQYSIKVSRLGSEIIHHGHVFMCV